MKHGFHCRTLCRTGASVLVKRIWVALSALAGKGSTRLNVSSGIGTCRKSSFFKSPKPFGRLRFYLLYFTYGTKCFHCESNLSQMHCTLLPYIFISLSWWCHDSTSNDMCFAQLPYLLDCNPRLIKFFFIISCRLQSRADYIFFFSLSKYIDDAQFFFGLFCWPNPLFAFSFLSTA